MKKKIILSALLIILALLATLFYFVSNSTKLEKLCEQGDGKACEHYEQALEKDCLKDKASACYALALRHDQNTSLLNKACELGYARACAELGDLYRQGLKELDQDLKQAQKLYEKACELEAETCASLAEFMDMTKNDSKQAAMLYE